MRGPWSRSSGAAVGVVVAVLVGAGCGGSRTSSPDTSTSTATRPPAASGPLRAPSTSATADAAFLTDVGKADSTLASYEQSQGPTALRALLTDGSAFCALLERDRDVDSALVGLATGAQSVEAQTRLPLGVTTFNTVEAVALLRLCPGEQSLIPASARSRIRSLGDALGS